MVSIHQFSLCRSNTCKDSSWVSCSISTQTVPGVQLIRQDNTARPVGSCRLNGILINWELRLSALLNKIIRLTLKQERIISRKAQQNNRSMAPGLRIRALNGLSGAVNNGAAMASAAPSNRWAGSTVWFSINQSSNNASDNSGDGSQRVIIPPLC